MQLMKMKKKEMKEEDLGSTDGDDLALFKDMRAKERENFLHGLSDDSDESISIKLGSFSSFKFDVSEKHDDLLNADRGKTDYNWLLTPPGTPLFPKLDRETPHVERSDSSILQSKPRNIPRIRRTESSTKRAQTSSSPLKSSPVSSSCSITSNARSRACSTPSSNGNFNTHHSTSSVRSTMGTVYSSTASARSSTNSIFSTTSLQRSSTSSSSSSSLVAKGAPSLQHKNCRISSSPQRQARQPIIPVISFQPQNSCPTTSELNPLHKRGSPPASRYRAEIGNKSRRQSVSPTLSRTVSSLKNHEGHTYILSSKETTSSNSDIMKDSRLKIKRGSYTSNRNQSPSKGSGRLESASTILDVIVSKKSPNSRTQQRNLHQNSQSMFRPLLSDAPVTSFYARKARPLPCQTKSYDPSMSTSGNGSYEHGCFARINEVTSEGSKDLRNKSSKCSISHEQENFQASEKMEIKSQDGEASLGSYDRQHSNHHVSHEHGVIPESECQNNGNMPEEELAASIDIGENDICFRGSCNDLNKDENSLSLKPNNADSHKLKKWVLGQENSSNLDLETFASKTNLKVASGVLVTAGESSDIYKAEYCGKDVTLEGPVDLFSGIVSDRCSLKSKASATAVTEIEFQTNAHKSEGSETYAGKNGIQMPRESLMTSQKDDKPSKQIALESINQEENCLSKEVSSLETEDYGCIKSPELLKNCGCIIYEKVRDDTTTQALFESSMQGKELEDTGRNSVASEIGDLLQACTDVAHIQESNANDCKCDSLVNFETDSILVTVNPSSLETNMAHPNSASLEGDKYNDGNAITVPASVKAQDVGVSEGDGAVPTDGRKRCLSRSMTLDEATDTVLFCSSIVHDLVYRSTMIEMQKEIPQVTPLPAMTTMVGTSRGTRRNSCRRASAQRMLTYKTINLRQTVAHLHTPSTRIQTTIEDQQPVMHVSIRERNKAPMPKKVNSKCCCSIL